MRLFGIYKRPVAANVEGMETHQYIEDGQKRPNNEQKGVYHVVPVGPALLHRWETLEPN